MTVEWPKGYHRGSTIFKEKKRGGEVGCTCVLCDKFYSNVIFDSIIEQHETLHLLQQIRANLSNQQIELVMQGEDE